jgi:hypothetical protein
MVTSNSWSGSRVTYCSSRPLSAATVTVAPPPVRNTEASSPFTDRLPCQV